SVWERRCIKGDLKLSDEHLKDSAALRSACREANNTGLENMRGLRTNYGLPAACRHTGRHPKGSGTAPISAAQQALEKALENEVGRGSETGNELSPVAAFRSVDQIPEDRGRNWPSPTGLDQAYRPW